MYDADEPGKVINEFLVTLFVPGILAVTVPWVAFRRYLDGALLAYGLPRIVPQSGGGAVSAGYGRLALPMLLSAAILFPYIGLYVRVLREPLRERGIV